MNSENFAEYLTQPAKLYQLPYQEIKNLVAEYPYATNLRLLMYIKSKIEHDPSFEKHLHQLAAHTFDRDFLYDLTEQQLKEMLDLATGQEDRLELQDLANFEEKEILTVDIDIADTPSPLVESTIPTPTPDLAVNESLDSMEGEGDVHEQEDELEQVTLISEPQHQEDSEPQEQELDLSGAITPTEPVESKQVNYLPPSELLETITTFPLLFTDGVPQVKSSFRSWRYYVQSQQQKTVKRLRKKARHSMQGFGELTAQQVAAKSVRQKSGVATETLAKLLEKQGNSDKAIKMYEQLKVLNPKKGRYFDSIIEKLKTEN